MESDLAQLSSPTEEKQPSPDSSLLPNPDIGQKKSELEAQCRDVSKIGEVSCPPSAMRQAHVVECGGPLKDGKEEGNGSVVFCGKDSQWGVEIEEVTCLPNALGQAPVGESGGPLDELTVIKDKMAQISIKEDKAKEQTMDSDLAQLGSPTEGKEPSPGSSDFTKPEIGLNEPELEEDLRDSLEDREDYVELPHEVNQWVAEYVEVPWHQGEDYEQSPDSSLLPNPEFGLYEPVKNANWTVLIEDWGDDVELPEGVNQWGVEIGGAMWPLSNMDQAPVSERGSSPHELTVIEEKTAQISIEQDEGNEQGFDLAQLGSPTEQKEPSPGSSDLPKPESSLNEPELEADWRDSIGEGNGTVVFSDEEPVKTGKAACPPNAMGQAPVLGGPPDEMTVIKDETAQISIKKDKGNEQKIESDLAQLGSPTEREELSPDSLDLPNPEFDLYEPELEAYWRVSTEDWDNYVEMPEGVNQWGVEIGGVTRPLNEPAPVSERGGSPHELAVTEDEMDQISIKQEEGNAQGMEPELDQLDSPAEDEEPSSASSLFPRPKISHTKTKLEAQCRDLIQSFRNVSASSSRVSGYAERHGGPSSETAGFTTWTFTPRSTYSPIPMPYDEFALFGHRPLTHTEIERVGPLKMKRLRSRLCAYLHAIRCLYREIIGMHARCEFVLCISKREILRHVMRCQDLVDCTFPRCVKVSRLLRHYTICAKKSCPLCKSFIARSPRFCCCTKPHST